MHKRKRLNDLRGQPLLSPPGGGGLRVEVTEQDWVDMEGALASAREKGRVLDVAEVLAYMKLIDPTKAVKPGARDCESMSAELNAARSNPNQGLSPLYLTYLMSFIDKSGLEFGDRDMEWAKKELGSCRRKHHGLSVAFNLHFVNTLRKGCVIASDQDWADMKNYLDEARGRTEDEIDQFADGLVIMSQEEELRDKGRDIARQLFYMKSLDGKKAPKPTSQDWAEMGKRLDEDRSNRDGAKIASMLYWMKRGVHKYSPVFEECCYSC